MASLFKIVTLHFTAMWNCYKEQGSSLIREQHEDVPSVPGAGITQTPLVNSAGGLPGLESQSFPLL